MYGNHRIYFASSRRFFVLFCNPNTNQTTCACACLPLVTANGWSTTKPKLSRSATNSTATSLALIAPSGVPPADGVDMIAIVVCALVRMTQLAEKPSEMGYPRSTQKRTWQHLRSSLDKVRKPRVLLCLHHVQPGTQNYMFDVIADISPINYRRPHGRIRSALHRTQDGFCVEHYFFEMGVRRDDEKKIVPHGRQLCANRAETRCDAERPCEGERRLRRRDAERKMDRFLQGTPLSGSNRDGISPYRAYQVDPAADCLCEPLEDVGGAGMGEVNSGVFT